MPTLFKTSIRRIIPICGLLVVWFGIQSCTSTQQQASTGTADEKNPPQNEVQASDISEDIDPSLLDRLKNERWTGDLDGLRDRRYIRALVLYNKTNFFYDGPQ